MVKLYAILVLVTKTVTGIFSSKPPSERTVAAGTTCLRYRFQGSLILALAFELAAQEPPYKFRTTVLGEPL
jgi:hypothetical protein